MEARIGLSLPLLSVEEVGEIHITQKNQQTGCQCTEKSSSDTPEPYLGFVESRPADKCNLK